METRLADLEQPFPGERRTIAKLFSALLLFLGYEGEIICFGGLCCHPRYEMILTAFELSCSRFEQHVLGQNHAVSHLAQHQQDRA